TKSVLPSQPVRYLPLKIASKPSVGFGACGSSHQATAATPDRTTVPTMRKLLFIGYASQASKNTVRLVTSSGRRRYSRGEAKAHGSNCSRHDTRTLLRRAVIIDVLSARRRLTR